MRKSGYTLIEMLAAVFVIAVVSILVAQAGWQVYTRSSLAVSANNIRVLTAGATQYLADNEYKYWKYQETHGDGILWWWGLEATASFSQPEGSRTFDPAQGPLAGYVPASIQPDPSFKLTGAAFKPKYQSGYIGIGYNVLLGGGFYGTKKKPATPKSFWALSDPAKVVVFATSAQVYPFSSAKNPKIEEFYGIDEREVTIHFRHGGAAMVGFANGSAGFLPMDESTRDKRMPEANVGRFAPKGSKKYLE